MNADPVRYLFIEASGQIRNICGMREPISRPWDYRQKARHSTLIAAFVGSNPTSPVNMIKSTPIFFDHVIFGQGFISCPN